MKVCVFIFFMVIQVISCDKDTSKLRRKLIVPKINDKCKKIKCAPTEEPECVKLWRQDLGHTLYINVINKCELEYMKCHDGVEAKIVPMKFCGHGNGMSKANNKKNKTSQAHVRVKRNTKRKTESNDTALASPSLSSIENRTILSASNTSGLKKDHHKWKHEDLNFISKDMDLDTRMKKNGGKSVRLHSELGYPYSTDFGSDTEKNERKKIGKGLAGHPLSVETDYEVPLKVIPSAPVSEFLEGKQVATDINKMKRITKYPHLWFKKPWWTQPEMASKETLQNKKFGLADADIKEQEELCPAVCASRDVMVCAKCQHGIYKTFISICHMRLFSCNHNDEVLELISRYPCVLSAPYLSEQDMVPKGRIIEATDDDKVLRFIVCRDKNQLGLGVETGDPRCTFETKPVLRGIGIRLPTSSEDKSSSITLGSSSDSSSWSKSSDKSSSVISTSSGATSTGLSSSGLTSDSSKC